MTRLRSLLEAHVHDNDIGYILYDPEGIRGMMALGDWMDESLRRDLATYASDLADKTKSAGTTSQGHQRAPSSEVAGLSSSATQAVD
jgi:hypothetical protein